MPATAGRVRMPANNRVHSSAALQTHGIWQSAIGYDPYAPNKDDAKKTSGQQKSAAAEPEPENTYASFQGLLALARITGTNADEARGACKKCGRVGHLTYQCRNFLSVKDDAKEKDPEAVNNAVVLPLLDKLKGVAAANGKNATLSDDESDEEEESDDSDSDVDSEMERIIAERYGKKLTTAGNKGKSSKKKKDDSDDDDDSASDSDSDSGERKKKKKKKEKRGRSRHRRSGKKRSSYSSDDESDGGRKRRKEKRRRKTESSDDDDDDDRRRQHRKARREKRRRRSHYSDESDSDASDDSRRRWKRRSRKAVTPSDSQVAGSDDSRAEERARKLKRSSRNHRDRNHNESS